MREYMVVAMDQAKARFLTLQQAEVPEFMSGPNLVELEVLYNREEQASVGSAFSGGQYLDAKGVTPGNDDQRKRRREELHRRFFEDVMGRLERLSRTHHTDRLVLVADARTLGRIRGEVEHHINGDVRVDELAENLAGLNAGKLHVRLADQSRLPERKPPGARVH